jgi:hypothetical protein
MLPRGGDGEGRKGKRRCGEGREGDEREEEIGRMALNRPTVSPTTTAFHSHRL